MTPAICALCFVLLTDAHAAPLVIGAMPGMVPPLDTADSVDHCSSGPGVPHGISTAYAQAVAERLGLPLRWRFFATRHSL